MDTGQRLSAACTCVVAAYEMIMRAVAAPKDAPFPCRVRAGRFVDSQGSDWLRRRPSGRPRLPYVLAMFHPRCGVRAGGTRCFVQFDFVSPGIQFCSPDIRFFFPLGRRELIKVRRRWSGNLTSKTA